MELEAWLRIVDFKCVLKHIFIRGIFTIPEVFFLQPLQTFICSLVPKTGKPTVSPVTPSLIINYYEGGVAGEPLVPCSIRLYEFPEQFGYVATCCILSNKRLALEYYDSYHHTETPTNFS